MSDQAQREFDRYARNYEADLETAVPAALSEGQFFAQYKVDFIAMRMARQPPAAILDFGCGIGLCLSLLKKKFPASSLHGYDVSSESLHVARGRVEDVHLTDDLDALPPESFDCVMAANVFHHIPPAERIDAFERCRQLLKPRGRLFVFEHNPRNPLTRYVFERCAFDRDAEMILRADASRMAVAAGLSLVRADYTLFFPRQLSLLRPFERLLGRLPLGAQYCLELSRGERGRSLSLPAGSDS